MQIFFPNPFTTDPADPSPTLAGATSSSWRWAPAALRAGHDGKARAKGLIHQVQGLLALLTICLIKKPFQRSLQPKRNSQCAFAGQKAFCNTEQSLKDPPQGTGQIIVQVHFPAKPPLFASTDTSRNKHPHRRVRRLYQATYLDLLNLFLWDTQSCFYKHTREVANWDFPYCFSNMFITYVFQPAAGSVQRPQLCPRWVSAMDTQPVPLTKEVTYQRRALQKRTRT